MNNVPSYISERFDAHINLLADTITSKRLFKPDTYIGNDFYNNVILTDEYNYIARSLFRSTGINEEQANKLLELTSSNNSMLKSEKEFVRLMRKAVREDFILLASSIVMKPFPVLYRKVHFKVCMDLEKNLDKRIAMVLMPRGTFKSALIGCLGAVHDQIKLRTNDNPDENFDIATIVAHGDIKKSIQNISKIREFMTGQYFQWLYHDEFSFSDIVLDGSEAIKFAPLKNTSNPAAKEPTFFSASPNVDPTGVHVGRILCDDWATKENCSTIDTTISNKDQFWRLVSLEDHVISNHGGLKIRYVATPENDLCVTHELYEKESDDIYKIVIPIYDDNGELNFPEELPVDKLEYYKSVLPSQQFRSQYLMQFYKIGEQLEFTGELPTYELPEAFAVKAILLDPAVSKKRKTACLMPILVIGITNGNLYVIDGEFHRGGLQPSALIDRIKHFASRHNPTYLIIESVAAQEFIADHIRENISNKNIPSMTVINHKHRESKAEHIRAYLEPLFRDNRVFINPSLTELIDEINAKSAYVDGIDCLAFSKELKTYLSSGVKGAATTDTFNVYHTKSFEDTLRNRQASNNNPFTQLCPWLKR